MIKKNYWKIATIILAIVIITEISIIINNNREIDISGVPIKNGNFDIIRNLISNSSQSIICDYDTMSCFAITRTS